MSVAYLKQSGRAKSSSGGKDYHLILLQNDELDRAILIQRWAKKSQWGNGWKLTKGTISECMAEYRKLYRAKLQGEYTDHFINKNGETNDAAEVRRVLGPQYLAAIGGKNMHFLLPDSDWQNLKQDGQAEVEWEQDEKGNWHQKEKERRLVETPAPPEPAIEERVAANSNWGTWG
jgi:hypothetical protein